MRSLFGLKNMIMFSAVLLTISSVSAQQAFAGSPACVADKGDGNWEDPNTWSSCGMSYPQSGWNVQITEGANIIVTGNQEADSLTIQSGSLFVDCDASLNLFGGNTFNNNVTNHGTFTAESFNVFGQNSHFFNSGDYSGVTTSEGGSIVEISSICDKPIGGTVGSMDTVSLLIAGSQTNMGWWALALVGIVIGSGIALKTKSNKTKKE